jgi:uncharacterized membrane protein YfcA
MSLILLLTLVCVITYTFEIIFGLAGTIMMLMLMTPLFGSKTLVIYSVMPQLLTGTIGLLRSPKTVDLRFLLGMLAFGAIGAAAGLVLFYHFSVREFHLLLSGAITLFGLYLVISPHSIRLNRYLQRLLDMLAGASQALFGISGPIAMTRLLGTFENKLVIRNYALSFFLSLNLIRLGGYLVNNTVNADILEMMLISGPVIAIALWYSNHLHMKVNERVFRRMVSWIILLGGISLFLQTP